MLGACASGQLPLQDVGIEHGPTALCPATHSEAFCRRYLPGLCPRGRGTAAAAGGGGTERAVAAMHAYVRLSGLCKAGSTRVHGTGVRAHILAPSNLTVPAARPQRRLCWLRRA